MRRYEGLFVLNLTGEDALKETLDRIEDAITATGGKVENVQKMDLKTFARPTRKHASGFYANVVFQSPPAAVDKLRNRFKLDEQIYRAQITHAEEFVAAVTEGESTAEKPSKAKKAKKED